MHVLEPKYYEGNNIMWGYTEEMKERYGVTTIDESELFNRIEFAHMVEKTDKVVFAVSLGWRFNKSNGTWYRLKGI